ncbi:MAG: 2-C-methyl-D-erythritol 4-phosphate cytidylyltransferase [Prevotella sp.]|nr:2-C-methyl-D-erythritol 4-phosphate cytidylyltransferase [Prevotella sp.]MDD3387972.1 2-C-methyl-D-erythritol 4-phosphate cytidylyltransferase [Prevotella sp.]MDD4534674.1 2-C-methyl-D-erythritol 4-phosphate cytidylyltransferase [Prevotella sp.]
MDYVIIVAGGKGLRMGSELPKQFMPIGGKPVLMYTIEQFLKYSPDINIIVVLPRNQQEFWNKLCEEHNFNIPHTIADGGESRFESSKNGLSLIPDNEQGVVAFHDGVRPFVSIDVIERCFDAARDDYAAIPVMPVTDTLRYVDRGHGHNVERNNFRSVQTPQVFDISLAKQAFDQPYRPSFTDDATVIESLGCQVSMVEGNRENIKLTTPFDLQLAELLIRHS